MFGYVVAFDDTNVLVVIPMLWVTVTHKIVPITVSHLLFLSFSNSCAANSF